MKLRRTLNSSPNFIKKLRQLQGKIKARDGIEPSLTDLTEEIVRVPAFIDVENQIMNDNSLFNIRIKFDRKI